MRRKPVFWIVLLLLLACGLILCVQVQSGSPPQVCGKSFCSLSGHCSTSGDMDRDKSCNRQSSGEKTDRSPVKSPDTSGGQSRGPVQDKVVD
jgi:hypothetical protein